MRLNLFRLQPEFEILKTISKWSDRFLLASLIHYWVTFKKIKTGSYRGHERLSYQLKFLEPLLGSAIKALCAGIVSAG